VPFVDKCPNGFYTGLTFLKKPKFPRSNPRKQVSGKGSRAENRLRAFESIPKKPQASLNKKPGGFLLVKLLSKGFKSLDNGHFFAYFYPRKRNAPTARLFKALFARSPKSKPTPKARDSWP